MWKYKFVFVLGCVLHSNIVQSEWLCASDSDCSSIYGSTCSAGNCVCPSGQQKVLGGSQCANASPYLGSSCLEDQQCVRLFSRYECRRNEDSQVGNCFCQSGFHFLNGRCWPTIDYEESCTRDEECMGLRDPYSLKCDGVCVCADGYYLRQRGECRQIASAVGDSCVLDEDCQFPNGACDINTFTCYDSSAAVETQQVKNEPSPTANNVTRSLTRQLGVSCDSNVDCGDSLVCNLGECVCPIGYYASEDSSLCLANLGSPSTAEQCAGFLAEVRGGICTCPVNFYFEENMVDCIKVTRRLTDACTTDNMCLTFGAASRCSEPILPFFFRQCECTEQAVWDEQRQMCRLFVGIGEACQANTDCLAGDMEILCATDITGQGVCVCPDGYVDVDGLCLTSGLQLGDSCQASQECTQTANTVCEAGTCVCGPGYQEASGYCAPTIGGSCQVNADCLIENSVCVTETEDLQPPTCQCASSFVEADDLCWPTLPAPGVILDSQCTVSVQCQALLGNASSCVNNSCACDSNHHFRDGGCWPQIGLFDTCSRTSECYLHGISDRVLCRNSLCQCAFEYPYSEELHTCGTPLTDSSTSTLASSILVAMFALYHVVLN